MKFDIFLSICQTEVDGYMPTERVMWENFFDQIKLADDLGFETAWVAETHLSCEEQKQNANAVIPHFKGEIGLNTDILQLAHKVFAVTKNIHIGSAIMNILANGGPIAHAEAIRTFLSLHGLNSEEERKLHVGFASGRFEFSNRPYGIVPRNRTETAAWSIVKGKILAEATEIFLRLLRGDVISSAEVRPKTLTADDFRNSEEWDQVVATYKNEVGLDEKDPVEKIEIPPTYNFDKVGLIPKDAPMHLLKLTIGTHDPQIQALANEYMPVGVFNLSITPSEIIAKTHKHMSQVFHKSGGPWQREMMPRTAMIYLDNTKGLSSREQTTKALEKAEAAWRNYWKAMEGTLDKAKVEKAVSNTIAGSPKRVAELIKEKYDPKDRLMLWFDFNNHNNEDVKNSMKVFMTEVKETL